jgi:Zn-dependent protease with chaperone function
MDFFERQDRARRHTRLLVVYFVLGVAMLIVAVYAALVGILTGIGAEPHHGYRHETQLVLWNPQLFLGAAVGTLAVIAMGSGFKTLELARGGSAVATMLGGRLVDPGTTDPDERKLRNVVEEMAIAAGIPVPQVYVLPGERGINAFAAGHSNSDAVVAVTAGAMRMLSRDELQGVIAHEFSHILNGDMRLNLRLMGIIFGILCLAVIGRVLLYTRSRSSKDKNPLPLLGLVLIVIGWAGGALWPAHPGGGQPAAGVPRRCLRRAVHAQPGGPGRRAQEDRRAELWL